MEAESHFKVFFFDAECVDVKAFDAFDSNAQSPLEVICSSDFTKDVNPRFVD